MSNIIMNMYASTGCVTHSTYDRLLLIVLLWFAEEEPIKIQQPLQLFEARYCYLIPKAITDTMNSVNLHNVFLRFRLPHKLTDNAEIFFK